MGKLSELASRVEYLERKRDQIIDELAKSDLYVGAQFMTKPADDDDHTEDGDPQYDEIDVTDFKGHFCHMLIELINKRIDVLKHEINTLMFPPKEQQR